jgi:Holliday junction resolvase
MIELYSTNEVIVKTYENHNYNNYLMKMDKGNGYKELIRYMEDRGWKFVEQMGSGFLFTKDQQKLIVTTKMVTRYFIEIKIDKDII